MNNQKEKNKPYRFLTTYASNIGNDLPPSYASCTSGQIETLKADGLTIYEQQDLVLSQNKSNLQQLNDKTNSYHLPNTDYLGPKRTRKDSICIILQNFCLFVVGLVCFGFEVAFVSKNGWHPLMIVLILFQIIHVAFSYGYLVCALCGLDFNKKYENKKFRTILQILIGAVTWYVFSSHTVTGRLGN